MFYNQYFLFFCAFCQLFSLLSSAEIIAAQQEIRISESDPASNADRNAPIRTLGE